MHHLRVAPYQSGQIVPERVDFLFHLFIYGAPVMSYLLILVFLDPEVIEICDGIAARP